MNTNGRTAGSVAVAMPLLINGLLSSVALAQVQADPATIRYYVSDLGEFPSCSTRASYRATAINDCGVIVGYVEEGPSHVCVNHGWVWSLCGTYGVAPRTLIDLSLAAGDSELSQAWDVNSSGCVVGAQSIQGVTRPIVWRVDQYSAGTIPRVILGNNQQGEAHGINDPTTTAPAPIVVGWTTTGTFGTTDLAFKHVFGVDGNTTLTPLNPFGDDHDSRAFDVTTPTATTPAPWVGGFSGFVVVGQSCAEQVPNDAVRWALSGTSAAAGLREDFLPSSSPLNLQLWDAKVNAANVNRYFAGTFRDPSAVIPCKYRAGFWRSDGTAIDLWASAPAALQGSDSQAYGMSAADSAGLGLLVVGAETSAVKGALWWRASTPSSPGSASFVTRRADDLCFAGNGSTWQLYEFQDVNSQGWLVGQGLHVLGGTTDPARVHAFLLAPVPQTPNCLAELTGDGVINGADLGVLTGDWTPPGTTCSGCCLSDLNHDLQVNAGDLGILLGAWGGTCTAADLAAQSCAPSCLPPLQMESAVMSLVEGAQEVPSLDSPVAMVMAGFGFSNLNEFTAWLDAQPSTAQANVLATLDAILGGQ
ncbi:MAG: hypothetical protein U0572_04945 [Phycisphaerales bacterium]